MMLFEQKSDDPKKQDMKLHMDNSIFMHARASPYTVFALQKGSRARTPHTMGSATDPGSPASGGGGGETSRGSSGSAGSGGGVVGARTSFSAELGTGALRGLRCAGLLRGSLGGARGESTASQRMGRSICHMPVRVKPFALV